MKSASCGALLCILIVVSGQIDDEYKILDSEETETSKPENGTKDGEFEP